MLLIISTCSCSHSQKATASLPIVASSESAATRRVFIYKTKADYAKLVLVSLTKDKSAISSYPDPADLKIGNGFAYPTELTNGYLLDNKGISINAAFLNITYNEYAKLPSPPEPDELLKLVIEKDPLIELWDCGTMDKGPNLVNDLNTLIVSEKLQQTCKRLK